MSEPTLAELHAEVAVTARALFERWECQVALDNARAREIPGLNTLHGDWPPEVLSKLRRRLVTLGAEALGDILGHFGYEFAHGRFVDRRAVHFPGCTAAAPYPDLVLDDDDSLEVKALPTDVFNHIYLHFVHYPFVVATRARVEKARATRLANRMAL